MPTVYAILGDNNSRKSSTARALTGAAQRGVRTVATSAGNIDVFVQISSLQEQNIMPPVFIAEMTAAGRQNILVTLWVSQLGAFPAGTDYLREFANAGWIIRQIVVLGTTPLLPTLHAGAPAPNQIPNSPMIPTNQIASLVRGWWSWL
jgi:hypothetical protein